ncbi:MAG: AtpZ/AtpI family protein, partial [Candidatus Woesearchaeota archaeon]|nr:AtpZ/AtpI family protein [Candidatus Woesearchaeota archaeon]
QEKPKENSDKNREGSAKRNIVAGTLGFVEGFLLVFFSLAVYFSLIFPGLNQMPSELKILVIGIIILFVLIGYYLVRQKLLKNKIFLIFALAGLVAGLVCWTAFSNITNESPPVQSPYSLNAIKLMVNCKSFCETKDYARYCTVTMKDITGSIDWNGDMREGRLYKDRVSVWDFCEDSVYCFLVTKCESMDMDGCRTYMCQEYMDKYKDPAKATEKLKELYKYRDASASAKEDTCYMEVKKGGPKTYFTDLAPKDNWLYAGFESKGWCSNTLSAE